MPLRRRIAAAKVAGTVAFPKVYSYHSILCSIIVYHCILLYSIVYYGIVSPFHHLVDWVAVKGSNLSYIGNTQLLYIYIYTHHGDLI